MFTPHPPEPSLWRRALRVLAAGVIGGAVVTALGVGLHHGMEDEGFRVQQVEILGASRASPVALRHLARVPEGAHLASLDLAAVRADVERHPWVAEATVSRALPSTLRIEVREHQPVMLLALDRLWYLNAQGEPFRLADSDDLDYPVLTGFPPQLVEQRPELSLAAVRGAFRVLDALDDAPIASSQLSEIHFDERLGYELVLRNGTRLTLGFEDPQPGLSRLSRMIAQGLDLDSPQRIDLVPEAMAIAAPLPPLP
mgnify:CR=1 FL=1